jgi:hypothetical protein
MIKTSSSTGDWEVYDSSRGPFGSSERLEWNTSDAEPGSGGGGAHVNFTSTGFTLPSGVQRTSTNETGVTYIYAAWAGSYSDFITDVNTTGTITSRVKANPTYGFSVVSYTGNGSASQTIGHGLGSAPSNWWVIIKNRTSGSTDWATFHSSISSGRLKLNTTDDDFGNYPISFNTDTITLPSVNDLAWSSSSNNYIAYCWSAISGYSKFDSYEGTGNANLSVTGLGFAPAWIIIKNADDSGGSQWMVYDNTRDTTNPISAYLQTESSNAETAIGTNEISFDSDGFTVNSTTDRLNRNGDTMIYAAFADTRESAFWLDSSGNNNDFQHINLDHNDTVSDSPTDNFATLNPLDAEANLTLSDGNLRCANPADSDAEAIRATIGVSSGQWYWEITCIANSAGDNFMFGIATADMSLTDYPGQDANGWGYYGNNGNKFHNGSSSSYGDAYTNGDVIGVVLDMDAGTLSFYKNGASQGQAFSSISGTVFPAFADGSSSQSIEYSVNFGQQPFVYGPPS